jgi:polyhydroxyalkanoate synthase
MTRLALDAARVSAEMAEFSRRMALAARTIAELGMPAEAPAKRTSAMQRGKTRLWRYESPNAASRGIPLVICYALVNRPTMLDLQPDRSLIRGLLARGVDVYLVDWGYPDSGDCRVTLEDYIEGHLGACVAHVLEERGIESVNLLGVCQGGTMSVCHAALHPERVRTLVTMVTPVDFRTDENLLSKWIRKVDVDAMVDALGNVPGELLNAAFLSLMPLRLTARKYAGLADLADDRDALANFLRMERWIHDSPDQAGAAFREFVRAFYLENRLAAGGLEIGGRPVDPRRITCPVLNVYARQDHLVPPSASRPLAGLTASRDYTEFEFDGGHIGIYVSKSAQELLPRTIAQWLSARQGAFG